MEQAVFQEVAAYDFGGPGYNLTGVRPVQVFLQRWHCWQSRCRPASRLDPMRALGVE
jgi:hypothetical protein